MAQFSFENMVTELTKLDGPIQNGPLMRWQRKAAESGLKLSVPLDKGGQSPRRPKSARTPGKTPKTPSTAKTPHKTPGKQGKAPSKTPSKTPGKTQAPQNDRFIPSRSTTDIDLGHFALMNENFENADPEPNNAQYQQHLNEALNKGQNPHNTKILSFKNKAPDAPEGYCNNLKVLYSCAGKSTAPKGTTNRQIPQQPERILDAPELFDDYYLNLLDWSCCNLLSVALGGGVYIWNSADGSIIQLMELQTPDDYVSSVNWVKEGGNFLGIGTSNGSVQLWDVTQNKMIRNMSGHAARVGSLSWNAHVLSSGSRSGAIYHHDVRVANHHVSTLNNHSQEVCGLAWSPDGRYLASGGNDNLLNIWDATLSEEVAPLHTFSHHQAAVKALAWCPWNPQLLASGGGTADRHIRFWSVPTGSCLNAVDTDSQVCSILWSQEYKELISGHGYSQNQLTIWKYPIMNRIMDLTGHTARVLCLTMSPDGTTVASAAADETIRLWKCFAVDKGKKETTSKPVKETSKLWQHPVKFCNLKEK
ncbi:CDC20 [Mytilus edulis]|uniref:CDC20 n=1 Tax=Mytilus edulis TaxID=6550 RepID=A0A8S3V1I9_MYTED|nr:CDC20 [Mytilus edulis]